MNALAQGILNGLPETLKQQRHLYIVTDGDIAHNLGHLFKEDERVKCEVLVIDGVTLWGFDFVDLGRIRMPSWTVPVTVKSLVFNEDPRAHGKSDPNEWHAHEDGKMHRHDHKRHIPMGMDTRMSMTTTTPTVIRTTTLMGTITAIRMTLSTL